MILYDLRCRKNHVFEAWFRDSAAYDDQAEAGEIACPTCGSKKVEKAPMAPRLAKGGLAKDGAENGEAQRAEAQTTETETTETETTGIQTGETETAKAETAKAAEAMRALRGLRRKVEDNFDYVGPQFAEEARKIHYGEADAHNIYGETSDQEAKELRDEGVAFTRVPWPPRRDS
ncbi:MAG: DUF1178 family protein [Proteobacteria bacterium]|nr:DUF1178 family protein [Pseudomonadota bacterium]MCH8996801.1 DUF1178 family protein [Pseudomonadota bacterium]